MIRSPFQFPSFTLTIFSLILGVALSGCSVSDQALDQAVERYMAKKEKQEELIKKVVKEELAKSGAPQAAPQNPTPPQEPSLQDKIKNAKKIEVGKSPSKGPKNAPITIVEFSDFQCPFCSRVNPTVDQLFKDYKGKIKVVFRNRPLSFHSQAKIAAQAAMAAHKQGKFWEMHDKLFANQRELSEANFEKWAKELGLNLKKFKKDYQSEEIKKRIEEDDQYAQKLGANGTPTFFINGVMLVGAQPISEFKKVIDALLK